MIEILVPHQIGKREIPPLELADARKLFAKLKAKPDLATLVSAKGLPERTSLFKVYATTAHGARRLLFFYRRPAPPKPAAPAKPKTSPKADTSSGSAESLAPPPPERWVLLFYRDKSDAIGKNMSPANPHFEHQLGKNFQLALSDLINSTEKEKRYDSY